VDICEYLLRYKARINAASATGQTPLHVAVTTSNSLATLQLLIRHRADVNRKDQVAVSISLTFH
jgi:ankyrin repeat protein